MRRRTSPLSGAMMGVCEALSQRVGGVHALSIRGASGPVRYNPQPAGPEIQQPRRRDNGKEARVLQSRLQQRWKRAPKKDVEGWELASQDQGGSEREEEGRLETEQGFASLEIRRLKSEMRFREATQSVTKKKPPFAATEEESSGDELAQSTPCILSEEGNFVHRNLTSFTSPSPKQVRQQAAVPRRILANRSQLAEADQTPAVKNRDAGSRLRYGDGREYEGVQSDMLDVEKKQRPRAEKEQFQGSGLFYGDGRKFEGLFSDADDSSGEFPSSMGEQFLETIDAEKEDKEITQEKSASKNYALRLLGIAPQTAHKLRQKLGSRGVSPSVIESTIADLQRCGLQSDAEYAEVFARSRWRSSIWGPQRLKQELRQRGVCPEDIEQAVHKVFTSTDLHNHDENDEEEEEGRWGMTKEASDHLLEKARRQWGRGGNISAEARKRRMIGWLQRRGFNWSITSQVLKSLESQDIVG